MTALWLIAAAAAGPHPWLLPAALAVILAVQVGGYLLVEKIFRAVARRRREGRS